MTNKTRDCINTIAENILKEYHINTPIYNMKRVVRELGGKVEEKAYMVYGAGGTVMKTGDDTFTIRIPLCSSKRKKNYLIACELGHLFLHMGYHTNDVHWGSQEIGKYKKFLSNAQMRQAVEFTRALMMPEKEFKEVFYKSYIDEDSVDLWKIARHFNVSIFMAKARGETLHLLSIH